jgi:hypothetical protein
LLVAVVVVTFEEGLGDDGTGFTAAQSGTMVHPIAKSNVATPERERTQADEEERVRFCISGEVVARICAIEWNSTKQSRGACASGAGRGDLVRREITSTTVPSTP